MLTLFVVLYIGAAVWRLSNLVVHEDGPSYMFARLRKNVKRSRARIVRRIGLVQLVNCEYCLSVWFGTALALGYRLLGETLLWVLLPLVLSTVAIVIKHVVFLIKSVDTRYDQQNQAHLANLNTPSVTVRENTSPTVWDAALFTQNSEERR